MAKRDVPRNDRRKRILLEGLSDGKGGRFQHISKGTVGGNIAARDRLRKLVDAKLEGRDFRVQPIFLADAFQGVRRHQSMALAFLGRGGDRTELGREMFDGRHGQQD